KIIKEAEHPSTADLIYRKAKKTVQNISLGTVYRNLHQLVEYGVIQEIFWGKEQVRYEYGTEEHPHFKCTVCDNLIKIHMPVTSMIIRGVEKNEGHSVDDMQMMIWGVCKDCKNKED
ncbi:MAG: transcriptional repressor, partial [Calditrichia bacterium]|nr:transcriptional repressor [Calditrichia bacterium]